MESAYYFAGIDKCTSPRSCISKKMDKVGKVSWKRFEKFLLLIGCEFKGQEGSHRKYKKAGLLRPIIIPCDEQLPQFIISNNLRTLEISKEDFVNLIKNL